jgi:peptidoglycan/LPS O-acetylase OafA/YrhL
MHSLGDRAKGRDNNLNLVRFLAAFAVLFSHSYQIALGKHVHDPLAAATGLSIGMAAVDVFFVTSGFLVTASLLTRGNVLEFVASRVLRIYPALVTVVLITVLAGVLVSTDPNYLSSPDTIGYVVRNATMIFGGQYHLPGVFLSNPYPGAVNGSLWTLPSELRMYTLLAILWVGLGVFGARRPQLIKPAIVLIATTGTVVFLLPKVAPGLLTERPMLGNRFLPAFFIGATLYVLREHIRLSLPLFIAGIAILVAAGAWLPRDHFAAVYLLTMPYVLLWVAYVPGGKVRRFNEWGDYSYGIYIWAWPVQQSVAALVPGVSVVGVVLIASSVTLLLAWCSWHWVEKRALNFKPHLLARGKRFAAG